MDLSPLRPPTLARELPAVVGVVLAVGLLWWRGSAFVLDGAAWGYECPEYLRNAWMVVHRQDVGYDYFRQPAHALLVGLAGEALGNYPDGGTLVASACAVLLVVALALTARALADPWAAGLAALAFALTPAGPHSARWVTVYPMLAAFSAAGVAMAACHARWPRVHLALGSGAFLAVAWATDSRGLVFVPVAAALVLVGAVRMPGWRVRVAAGLLFTLALASAALTTGPLLPDASRARPVTEQRAVQQIVAVRWAKQTSDPEVWAACTDPASMLGVASLRGRCADALWRFNLTSRVNRHLPFGLGATLLALALTALPGRRGWAASVDGLLWVVGSAVPLVFFLRWVPLPDRYELQHAALLCAALPVAASRLAQTLPGRRWTTPALCLAALSWVVAVDPSQRDASLVIDLNPLYADRNAAAAMVAGRLAPADTFLDCSGYDVQTWLLPRVWSAPPPLLRPESADRCLSWVRDPDPGEGTAWFGLDPHNRLRETAGGQFERNLLLVVEEAGDWELSGEVGGFQLWRHLPAGR